LRDRTGPEYTIPNQKRLVWTTDSTQNENSPNFLDSNVIINFISRCDGSAMLVSELGTVVCGVNGPVEAKEREQDPTRVTVNVILHPPSNQQAGPVHRQIERTISGLLASLVQKEANPRCQIQIILQPLESEFCVTPLGKTQLNLTAASLVYRSVIKTAKVKSSSKQASSLVNCAILAMLDAGIQMHHVAAGGTVALVETTVDEKQQLDLIGASSSIKSF
jgi:exosome complex component RRP46